MIAHVDARAVVLNVASSLRWVKETQGANRGEVVDEMIRLTSLDPGGRYPWCAAMVAYVGYSALRKLWPLPKVAGCMSLHDAAVAKGMLKPDPAFGAVFLQWGKAANGQMRFKHTGFCVEEIAPGVWRTIEGNTNTAGSPEGTGVFERTRSFGDADRFIHWWV